MFASLPPYRSDAAQRQDCVGVARLLTGFETTALAAGEKGLAPVIGGPFAPIAYAESPIKEGKPGAFAKHAEGQCCSFIDSMIVGSGIDMVEIGRIQQSMDRYGERFLDRIYTAAERAYCLRKRMSAESLAARFAAKEAGAKALGTGISHGVSWLEIEVVREPSGRPTLKFHGRAAEFAARLGATRAALSITHTAAFALASVVLEDGR